MFAWGICFCVCASSFCVVLALCFLVVDLLFQVGVCDVLMIQLFRVSSSSFVMYAL